MINRLFLNNNTLIEIKKKYSKLKEQHVFSSEIFVGFRYIDLG